jgi:magnesium-transporting ATPase (P-type)
MIIDQLMCLEWVLWRNSFFNSKKSIITSLSIILISIIFNIVLSTTLKHEKEHLFTNNYFQNKNENITNSTIDCISSSNVMLKVYIYIQSNLFYPNLLNPEFDLIRTYLKKIQGLNEC